MENNVLIFGKDDCPYTFKARKDFTGRNIPFDYINVARNPKALKRMLEFSNGKRNVPIIVEGEKVTIGFGGT